MNKKKIFLIIAIIVLLLGLAVGGFYLLNKGSKDALKFKEEYETLNDTKNSSGAIHRTVKIPKDNPFVYITAEEVVKKIENKETFYVYFGSPYCPWCRSVIEKAIEVAKNNDIDKIYYVDIWDRDHVEILRDTYRLNDDNEVELVTEGGKGYKDLLKYFANVLSDYTLTDSEGNKISVGEKRIFAPNFIYVQKGKAIKITDGISSYQENSRSDFTDEILKDEEKQFKEFFQN